MKFHHAVEVGFGGFVTLFTGVWIEMFATILGDLSYSVTLFTGVWIEIGIIS